VVDVGISVRFVTMSDERTAQHYDQDFVNTVKQPGRYNFGDGLFLDVKPLADGVGKYWLYAYNGTAVGDGPRERIGFGSAKTMPLKVARRESLLLDQVLESGGSPKAHREQLRLTKGDGLLTWKQAVEGFYDVCMSERWNSKHPRALGKTIKNNYLLTVKWAKQPLQAITHLHIAEILLASVRPYRKPNAAPGPMFKTKPEMGKRVQCFLFGMFRYWKARGKFKGENPADNHRGTDLHELVGSSPKGGHHQDIRVDEIPPLLAFMCKPQREAHLVTTSQLAAALGVSPIAIKNARKRYGLIGHREPGRLWKNSSYVFDIAEAERVFKRKIPPITMRADEDLYVNILKMIILTLARSDMICKLRWDEIKPRYQNSVQGMIIFDNHKTKRFGYTYGTVITPHIQAILDDMKERRERLNIDSPYVFPHGPVTHGLDRWLNQPSNPNTIEKCLRRCLAQIECIETKDATVHGMRTAFTTWACDMHEYDKDLAMITIGHTLKRPDADIIYLRNVRKLHQRHAMGTDWGDYCLSQVKQPQPQDDKIVKLHGEKETAHASIRTQ
jgi:hypothetical protein